jgi:hypothetical protein
MINFVLYLIAVFLLNSLKIGMITGNIFFIVWGIVNYFVQQFRGIPFQWIDFGSMRTAMSVSGNYRYTPTWQMITGVILVFVVCSFWSKRRTTLLFMNRAGKIGSRASAIILLFAFWVVIFRTDFLSGTGIWLRDWQPWYTYRLFGMESGFLAFAKASFPEAPEGYSSGEVKSIIDDYRAGGYKADVRCSEIPENLIVIMNESFSDLSIYPGFETDEDVPRALEAALGEMALECIKGLGKKRFQVDLKGIHSHCLEKTGVLPEKIVISDDCTACRPDIYWSHRKVGNERGVQSALIALKEV